VRWVTATVTRFEAAIGMGFGATVGLAAALSSAALGVIDHFLPWPVWLVAIGSAWGGTVFALVCAGGNLRPSRVGVIFASTLVLVVIAAIVWQRQHPPAHDTALDFVEVFVGPVALVLAIPLGLVTMVLARNNTRATGLPRKTAAWLGAALLAGGLLSSFTARAILGSHESVMLLSLFMAPAIPLLGAALISNRWRSVRP
jgi:hypothetical protein